MGDPISAIATFVKAVFIGAGSGASAAYVLSVNLARVALVALAAKLTAPKLSLTARAQTKTITLRDPIAPQTFVYGKDMVSGPICFANVGGTDNRDLWYAIAFAGHEIDSVTAYRIDDTDIALTDLSGSEDGTVDTGKFAGVAQVWLRKGTSSQAYVSEIATAFPSLWTTAHHGQKWAYMVWKFTLKEGNEAFKRQPQNIRVIAKGRKIYDPRKDSTNGGSGLHRLADTSTWEWSDNPALCLADFYRDDKFGMQEEDDRIDWDDVIAAADVCDELVSIPGATTQKRYTCNVTFSSDETRRAVRDELVGSMMGRTVFSQGKWRMWAGEAVTADVTLTEANLRGNISLTASTPSDERYNRVRGKFIDADRDYTAASYPEQRSSTYVTEDNEEVRVQVADFTSTKNTYEAQRKAIITLKQSRNQRVVVFEGNYSCFRLQPGLTVTLDIDEYGFASEKFFISEWKFADDGIDLTLVEENDTVWNDPAVGDYTERTETGALVFGESGVPAPTSPSATGQSGGVLLSWTNPPTGMFRGIQIWASDDNDRANADLVATVEGTSYLDQVSDTRTRYYWLRAINSFGETSDYEPDLTTTTLTGSASLLTGLDGQSVRAVNLYKLNDSSIDTPTAGTFANPLSGMEAGWGYSVPDLTADGDKVYVITRTLTDDGESPQDANWSTPSVYAERQDGNDGTNYQGNRQVNLFKLNDNTLTDNTQGTFADPLSGMEAGWSYSVPELSADGDKVYVVSRIFTSDGQSPQQATWSGPNIYAQRADGAVGPSGQATRTVNLYKLNDSTLTDNTQGTFADPKSGMEAGWDYSVPSLTADGDKVYVITRLFTDDGQSPQDATWDAPTIYAERVDGSVGPSGQSIRQVNLYKLNDSTLTDNTQGTFADPKSGMEAGWDYSVPSLAADGDKVYVISRTFTNDAQSPQDATWSGPTIYSERIDGDTGPAGQANRTVNLYKLNDSTIGTPTAGTFADPKSGMEAGWDYSVPSLAADGDKVYVITRTFTDDAQSPQDANWSTPAVYSERVDGSVGTAGQSTRTVNLYKLNDSTLTDNTQGTFADPLSGMEAGWAYTVPSLASNGDKIYVITRTFTSDAQSPQDATWAAPTVYAERVDGQPGQAIRVVNLYKLNDSTLTDNTQGTFADPKNGMEAGWDYSVPSLTADGDKVYVISRTFTDDAQSPQDATWDAPTVYAERVDGNVGSAGQSSRTVNLYKLNDSTLTDNTQGTFADPKSGMEAGWDYSVPSLAADGDKIYVITRTFTSDGQSPQDATWDAPTVYAYRVDGNTGSAGQSVRAVNLYKLNDSTLTDNTQGTFADPKSGMEAGWDYDVPGLAADGDKVYVISRTFTSDGQSPQDATWSGPTIYSERVDGEPGADIYTWEKYGKIDGAYIPLIWNGQVRDHGFYSNRLKRATSGTYQNSRGQLRTSPPNGQRPHHDHLGNLIGLLIEKASTNLIAYSEDFEHANWTKGYHTRTLNQEGPSGNFDATLMLETTDNNQHYLYHSFATTSGKIAGISGFIKRYGNRDAFIRAYDTTTRASVFFDLDDGSIISTGGSHYLDCELEPWGNGWYRFKISFTAQSSSTRLYVNTSKATTYSFTGETDQGLYIFGMQGEDFNGETYGGFPTSYIPTNGATATRATDKIDFADLSQIGLDPSTEFTVFAEYQLDFYPSGANTRIISLSDGTINERVEIRNASAAAAGALVVDGNTNQASFSGGGSESRGDVIRLAMAVKANDFAASKNGTAYADDTSGTLPVLDRLSIGRSSWTENHWMYGYIKKLFIQPSRLSDGWLDKLSSGEAPGYIPSVTDSPDGGDNYIGVSHNNTSATESTDPLDYTWSKFVASAGEIADIGFVELPRILTPPGPNMLGPEWSGETTGGDIAIVGPIGTGKPITDFGLVLWDRNATRVSVQMLVKAASSPTNEFLKIIAYSDGVGTEIASRQVDFDSTSEYMVVELESFYLPPTTSHIEISTNTDSGTITIRNVQFVVGDYIPNPSLPYPDQVLDPNSPPTIDFTDPGIIQYAPDGGEIVEGGINNLFHNPNGRIMARTSSGYVRPAGLRAAYGNTAEDTIIPGDGFIRLADDTDTSLGMIFQAFRFEANYKYRISFEYRVQEFDTTTYTSPIDGNTGMYIGMNTLTTELGIGKRFIDNSNNSDDEGAADIEQGVLRYGGTYFSGSYWGSVSINHSTSWQTITTDFTPDATDVWGSLQILNWTLLGDLALDIRNVRITPLPPTDLSELDSAQDAKLNGIEAGADVTATATASGITGQGDLATTNEADINYWNILNQRGANILSVEGWDIDSPTALSDDWTDYIHANDRDVIEGIGPFGDSVPILKLNGGYVSSVWRGNFRTNVFQKTNARPDPDFKKPWRFTCWVRLTDVDNPPLFYMGYESNNVKASGTWNGHTIDQVDDNPYFISSVSNTGTGLTDGKWYLAVGVIHGENFDAATHGNTGISGLYDPTTGQQVYSSHDYYWNSAAASPYVRIGMYYNNTTPYDSALVEVCLPRWEELTAETPRIESLLGHNAIAGSNILDSSSNVLNDEDILNLHTSGGLLPDPTFNKGSAFGYAQDGSTFWRISAVTNPVLTANADENGDGKAVVFTCDDNANGLYASAPANDPVGAAYFTFPIQNGERYYCRVKWKKSATYSGTGDDQLRVYLACYDQGGTIVAGGWLVFADRSGTRLINSDSAYADDTWYEWNGYATIPAKAKFARILIRVGAGSDAGTITVESVQISRIPMIEWGLDIEGDSKPEDNAMVGGYWNAGVFDAFQENLLVGDTITPRTETGGGTGAGSGGGPPDGNDGDGYMK